MPDERCADGWGRISAATIELPRSTALGRERDAGCQAAARWQRGLGRTPTVPVEGLRGRRCQVLKPSTGIATVRDSFQTEADSVYNAPPYAVR